MIKISIFIINYNNAKFLKRSINSALNQKYKMKEVIVYDDGSDDNSKKIISGFKNVKKIFINKKKYFGFLGQINGIKQCLKICKGSIICFLDSDDFFKKKKLNIVDSYFHKNKKINFVSDKPIKYLNQKNKTSDLKKYNQNRFFTWPRFSPQSCMSVRTSFLKNNLHLLDTKNFKNIWFDFRLSILSFLLSTIGSIDENLTYYQKNSSSVSAKWFKFSKIWWQRRLQAHKYIMFLKRKKIANFNLYYLDYVLTKIINFIYKIKK